ncbi:MAG: DUF5615 family PIN-like protein [Candidatus Anammoxibacter sp.]
MKFKLDECLDVRLAVLFSDAGYDAQTVCQENLARKPDGRIYSACIDEQRTLVTQDMDFSNPFRFSPLPSQGIIVLKNPSQLLSEVKNLIRIVILKIREERPQACLWIVDCNGIRIWPAK